MDRAPPGRHHRSWPRRRSGRRLIRRIMENDITMTLSTYDRLDCAVSGYLAQYGDRSLAEQHPELPGGCIERIEALLDAAIAASGRGRELLNAAKWVVHNWDTEATQHGSMGMLRDAVEGEGYQRPLIDQSDAR